MSTGGGAGKVNYSDLTVVAHVDKATPTIFNFAASGKHIPTVELAVHKAGGDSQIEYIRIILEDVIVTCASYDGLLTSAIMPVIYKFQAARIKHKYWEQTVSGGKGAETSSGWDIKKNCAI